MMLMMTIMMVVVVMIDEPSSQGECIRGGERVSTSVSLLWSKFYRREKRGNARGENAGFNVAKETFSKNE